jgi:outer membrane protein OmpA-like peptidoglycan-associated protein
MLVGRASHALVSSLSLALLPAVVVAQSTELPLSVQVPQMVNLPGETPRLTLRADDSVDAVQLTLTEHGRAVFQRNVGSLKPGAEHPISWRAEPGEHEYSVQVSGKTAAGHAKVAIDVVMDVMRPLEIALARDHVDLESRTLDFTMNNPAGRAQLAIYNASGRAIHEATTEFRGQPAGSRLVVTWPPLAEPIQRMELRIYDASDSWSGHELVPFTVEIPHEDVVFETAKWDIRASELAKLDAAYTAILDAIREHGSDIKARLYVLGHTDSVGSAADNQLLSRRRASEIARYFQQRGGISLPILAQGFGESRLAVPTGDNVDEARNRRAQYILAAQAPLQTDWVTVSSGTGAGPQ